MARSRRTSELLASKIGPGAGLREAEAASHLLVQLGRPESRPNGQGVVRLERDPFLDPRRPVKSVRLRARDLVSTRDLWFDAILEPPTDLEAVSTASVVSTRIAFPHLQHGRYQIWLHRGATLHTSPTVEVGERPATATVSERPFDEERAEKVRPVDPGKTVAAASLMPASSDISRY